MGSDFLNALVQTPLLQRALIAGALTGLCCALVSPLVVLRRMAFIGDGIAHTAFGGLGLALFVLAGAQYQDVLVQLVTLGFCLLVGTGIAISSRTGRGPRMAEDSVIGIAFSASLALGALCMNLWQRRNRQYVASLESYLFGNPVNIGPNDVWVLLGLAAVLLAVLIALRKEILFYVFDPELAELSGVRAGVIHYLLILLLVITVVVSARVVGILLVSASLIIPGVVALRLSGRLLTAMLISAGIGVASFQVGLYLSYVQDIPAGSAIVLVQFAILMATVAYSRTQTT